MVKEIKYVNIKEIVSRVLKHPLLKDFNLESAVQYVSDFIDIFGLPNMLQTKEEDIEIKDFRGVLPCDCVSINQVKDIKSGICLRKMSNTFLPNDKEDKIPRFAHEIYGLRGHNELSYKTQGNVIFTSFKHGKIKISYQSIPVDKDGYPLLIDNGIYLKTLELFIKKELFLVLFETGKVSAAVIQNVKQDYAFRAGQLQKEFTLPSVDEMESISRSWNTLLPRTTSFDNGFKDNANREYRRIH